MLSRCISKRRTDRRKERPASPAKAGRSDPEALLAERLASAARRQMPGIAWPCTTRTCVKNPRVEGRRWLRKRYACFFSASALHIQVWIRLQDKLEAQCSELCTSAKRRDDDLVQRDLARVRRGRFRVLLWHVRVELCCHIRHRQPCCLCILPHCLLRRNYWICYSWPQACQEHPGAKDWMSV